MTCLRLLVYMMYFQAASMQAYAPFCNLGHYVSLCESIVLVCFLVIVLVCFLAVVMHATPVTADKVKAACVSFNIDVGFCLRSARFVWYGTLIFGGHSRQYIATFVSIQLHAHHAACPFACPGLHGTQVSSASLNTVHL